MTDTTSATRRPESLERVVIRFAGDSGDGMQLVGDRFTDVSAAFGNDLATLPNYPAEIRAPAGTIAGVSSFQVHIADFDIVTPGDVPNLLVAMNPAALKANIGDLAPGASIIVNTDAFEPRNLEKAGYVGNPLDDDSLAAFTVYPVPMTSITVEAAKETGAKPRDAERSKNFFALGLISWMYSRPVDAVIEWIGERFAKNAMVRDANLAAFKAGYHFGETAEIFETPFEVHPATLPSGRYRNITGNVALAYGLIAAGQQAKLPILYASYPITPASDILHELSKHKNFGVRTMQAEDEIAAIGVAIGGAFAGQLGVTATSGPGVDLKAEALGLAVSLELPLILVDVQRGGPSTGLPTKTEQADLMLAMYGRHGEAPLPIVAAQSPSHCFDAAFEGARLAVKYRTPVIVLTDGYNANGSEPWLLPRRRRAPRHLGAVHHRAEPPQRRRQHRVLAVRAGRDDPRPAVGDPGDARADASHRRHREAGRHRQRQLRAGEPRAHDPPAGREDRPHRERHPAARGRRPRAIRPRCSCSGGGAPGARSRPRPDASAARASTSRPRSSPTSTRSRGTSATCWPPTRRCSSPR